MSIKDVLTLLLGTLGAAIALATLVSASFEYARRGRMERMQVFFDLRRRLKESELNQVAQLIDEAQEQNPSVCEPAIEKLSDTPFRIKRDYLGLFEEVGLAMEKGLIEPAVAHYMFGYYALHCAGCDAFWDGVGELNAYWNRFYEFCERMQAERKLFERNLKPVDRDIFRGSSSRAMPIGTQSPRTKPPGSELVTRPAAKVLVKVPTQLRATTEGATEFEVGGRSVGEVLERAIRIYPKLGERILTDSLESGKWELRRFVNLYLDGEEVRFLNGFETEVAEGNVITILPANAGG